MNASDLSEQLALTRLPRTRARQLPGVLYTSAAIADLEKDRIFMDTWLCAGRAEEIAKPGDYKTLAACGEPLVITRDEQGGVNAFVNMCLHRGVPVALGAGNARDFSCPYHAWLYDLKGQLTATPYLGQSEVDMKGARMKPLACAQWRDWIFVSFNPDPEPFADFIAPYERELWWFRTDQCRLAAREVLEIGCNWKLLVENLIDIYHVPVLHAPSFGGFLKSDRNALSFQLLERGGWVYEQKSRPHAQGGQQMFPTLPWLADKPADTSLKAGIFPNLNLSLRYDSLRLWQLWPTSPESTELHMYSLFAPQAFEQPDFWDKYAQYKRFILGAIQNEDGPMVVTLQKAMSSRFYAPGPMAHLEGAVHHIINHYLDVMALDR
jgi:Rieske 2Fe-2S family protein